MPSRRRRLNHIELMFLEQYDRDDDPDPPLHVVQMMLRDVTMPVHLKRTLENRLTPFDWRRWLADCRNAMDSWNERCNRPGDDDMAITSEILWSMRKGA